MSAKFDKANDAVRATAAEARERGQNARAAALDAVLTVTPENASTKRENMRALIAAAVTLESKGNDDALSDDTRALILADVAIAHAQYGFSEYADAASQLDALLKGG